MRHPSHPKPSYLLSLLDRKFYEDSAPGIRALRNWLKVGGANAVPLPTEVVDYEPVRYGFDQLLVHRAVAEHTLASNPDEWSVRQPDPAVGSITTSDDRIVGSGDDSRGIVVASYELVGAPSYYVGWLSAAATAWLRCFRDKRLLPGTKLAVAFYASLGVASRRACSGVVEFGDRRWATTATHTQARGVRRRNDQFRLAWVLARVVSFTEETRLTLYVLTRGRRVGRDGRCLAASALAEAGRVEAHTGSLHELVLRGRGASFPASPYSILGAVI